MSAPLSTPGSAAAGPGPSSPRLDRRRWRQILLMTAGAVLLFVGIRHLPTGTELSHQDYRAKSTNPIQFCDPLGPQFLPAETVKSPVTMTLTAAPAVAGREEPFTFKLTTTTGKPVGPDQLLVVHTKKLHLLIADPTLGDYQHVHPVPGEVPGEWVGHFKPRFGGQYRFFADFTPAATGRGLYATSDLPVKGPAAQACLLDTRLESGPQVHVGDYVFQLTAKAPVRVNSVADLALVVTRADGGTVPLEPLMGAFAHLVAFDEARSGFAHMHPLETDITKRPDAHRPRLTFKLLLPKAGRYVIWAEVNIAGTDTYAPFWFKATE